MLNRFSRSSDTAQAAGWAIDYRFATLIVGLVWVQMVYMALSFNELLTDPTALIRYLKIGLLAAGSLLLAWRAGLTWLLLRNLNPFLTLFVLLAGASFVWSIEPAVTLQRTIALVSLVVICLAFGLVSWNRTRFQQVLTPIITTMLVASLLTGLIDYDLVVEVGDTESLRGSWKGLTFQKNTFGQLAGFGVILWLHGWLARERRLVPVLIGLAISVTCLLLSRSSTSLLSTIFACMLLLLLLRSPPNLQRYMPIITALFAILVVTYAFAVLKVVPGLDALLTPISMITGKDTTFSNRSLIWEIIRAHIRFAPVLGSGFSAYWLGPQMPWSPSFVFYELMYFYPGQAHNGYLEVINDLGYVGALVLGGYLFVFVSQSVKLLRIDRSQAALFLGLFFMQAVTNLSQSIWFSANSFEFVMMMFANVAMARALLDVKLQQYFGAGAPPGMPPDGLPGSPQRSPLHWQGRIG